MTKAIMTDELREKKRLAGQLGAARTNALKAEKKAQGEYDQRTKLERNLAFDQELFAEVQQLREHTKTLPQFIEGTTEEIDWSTWLDSASSILRDSVWNKTYDENHQRDYEVPYKDRVCFDFPYPDFAASQLFISYCHLSPELRSFLVKVLESFLDWSDRHKEQRLDSIPEIKSGLQRLKDGKDFYNDGVIQRIHERLELEQQRIKQEQEQAERVRNMQYTPAPKFIPPPPDDPLVVAQRLAKQLSEERARLEEDNRLRQLSPEAWQALRGR